MISAMFILFNFLEFQFDIYCIDQLFEFSIFNNYELYNEI